MKVQFWLAPTLFAMGVIASPMLSQARADDAPKAEVQVEVEVDEAEVEAPAAKQYWLGVQLAPTPEILKTHVERLKDGAAMVAGVAPGSPAEKAGLKAGDHILKLNDDDVTSPNQVVDIVKMSKGEALSLEVLRGTEMESLTVKLEEAPADMLSKQVPVPQPEAIGIAPGEMGEPNARYRFFGPGQVVPQQIRVKVLGKTLPQNTTIRVERKNDEPTKLYIERDGKTWDITDKEIDKLPEDLQELARNYLEGGAGMIVIGEQSIPFLQMQERMRALVPAEQPHQIIEGPAVGTTEIGKFHKQLQKDMEEMREMMKQMHQRMDQMKKAVPVPPQPEEPGEA
ncbi:PDZ domain-containing protein [Bremerella cremea]|uniref:S1C family serine protease n=1 Tax=Bremerella cremea TaxID=1031537 RepID=UPI0031EF97C2